MQSTPPAATRAGFAAIVGRPNVGKSTLLNTVLDAKVAIVSRRPQTTRNHIRGVYTAGETQIVFVDTPGIHASRANLNRFMIQEALDSLDGVDCIIMVTEIQPKLGDGSTAEIHPDDRYVLEQIQLHRRPSGAMESPPNASGEAEPSSPEMPELIVAINKIDLLGDRRLLLPLMSAWSEAGLDRLVPISALKRDGIEQLLDETMQLMPTGRHLYPEEMYTDQAERFLAAELIREQVNVRCHQELPYAVAVEVRSFRERQNRGDVVIDAVIHVEREGQKGILVGKKGAMIKTIGSAARAEISGVLGCEVHLSLTVHVEADWTKSPTARRRFGYE